MKIQILGSGCPTCHKLYELTQQAVKELEFTDSVEYLTGNEGIQKIIELGSMSSPVLAINDEIVMVGYTPDVENLKRLIQKIVK
jgi:small redox-active disulfide protein 2